MHDATILYERLIGFGQLSYSLEDKVQVAQAWAKVVEEFLRTTKWEKKY